MMVQTKPEAVEGQNFRKAIRPLDDGYALGADALSKAQVFGFFGTLHAVQIGVKYRQTPRIFIAQGKSRASHPLL